MLVLTLAMLALHLVSATALRRGWVSALALLRAEAAYYVALIAFAALYEMRPLLIAAAVLGGLHLSAWIASERRRDQLRGTPTSKTLFAVQIFDSLEAVALAVIAAVLWRGTL